MKHSSTPVRVLRVFDGRGPCYISLVFEYTERGEFEETDLFEFFDKSVMDFARKADSRRHIWNALDIFKRRMRWAALCPELLASVKAAQSIDDAVSEGEARAREFAEQVERFRRGEGPAPTIGPAGPVQKESDPPVVSQMRDAESSPHLADQMDKLARQTDEEVWDYARGRRLRWKRVGRTPAGLEYEVLTVDGVEELYPGPASLGTSPRTGG